MHPISSYPDFKLSDLPKEAGDWDLFIYIIYIWICTLSSYPDFKLSEIFSSTASNTQGQTHPTGRQTLNGKGIPSPRKFLHVPETMNLLHEGEVLPTSKQADLDRSESQQELRCVRFGIWTIPLKGGCWPRVARPGWRVVLKNDAASTVIRVLQVRLWIRCLPRVCPVRVCVPAPPDVSTGANRFDSGLVNCVT